MVTFFFLLKLMLLRAQSLIFWFLSILSGIQKPYVPELRLHELRAEKYNGLVRLLKPGCRTIILITDMQSRPKLIPGFHKAVWPYRK